MTDHLDDQVGNAHRRGLRMTDDDGQPLDDYVAAVERTRMALSNSGHAVSDDRISVDSDVAAAIADLTEQVARAHGAEAQRDSACAAIGRIAAVVGCPGASKRWNVDHVIERVTARAAASEGAPASGDLAEATDNLVGGIARHLGEEGALIGLLRDLPDEGADWAAVSELHALAERAQRAMPDEDATRVESATEREDGDWTAGEVVRVQDAIERVLDEHDVGQDVNADALYALTLAAMGETSALRPTPPVAPVPDQTAGAPGQGGEGADEQLRVWWAPSEGAVIRRQWDQLLGLHVLCAMLPARGAFTRFLRLPDDAVALSASADQAPVTDGGA